MAWLVPSSHLTTDQQRAVEAPPTEHRLIVGSPGSGKTLVLLHRAEYLRTRMRSTPERFRIIVFTTVLREYIRSGCADLGIPLDCVCTYDQWCRTFYEENIGRKLPWNAAARSYDFDLIRADVAAHVYKHKPSLYDFVLVDEGQDLDPEAFAMLRTTARHVTVAADRKQQIYEFGATEEQIAASLGLPRRNLALLSAYRCSPYIVPLAASFIADEEGRKIFRGQTKTATGTRETPVLYLASSFEAEKQRLADMVRTRQLKGERIAILLPRNNQVHGFAQGLTEAGLEVELQRGRDGNALDFSSDRPKLMTYHSAKGLTFDSVLLPRVVERSFTSVSAERLLRLLFVAITRATNWVYLSAVEGDGIAQLEALDALEAAGQLVIHRGDGPPRTSTVTIPQPAAASGGLDDLF